MTETITLLGCEYLWDAERDAWTSEQWQTPTALKLVGHNWWAIDNPSTNPPLFCNDAVVLIPTPLAALQFWAWQHRPFYKTARDVFRHIEWEETELLGPTTWSRAGICWYPVTQRPFRELSPVWHLGPGQYAFNHPDLQILMTTSLSAAACQQVRHIRRRVQLELVRRQEKILIAVVDLRAKSHELDRLDGLLCDWTDYEDRS